MMLYIYICLYDLYMLLLMIMMFITILVVMVVIVTSNFYGGDRYASWKKMGTGQGIA